MQFNLIKKLKLFRKQNGNYKLTWGSFCWRVPRIASSFGICFDTAKCLRCFGGTPYD